MNKFQAWIALLIAIVFELIATYYVKKCEGMNWNRKSIVAASFFFYNVSIVADIVAMEYIDVGTGYGIWAGTGMVGSAVISFIGISKYIIPMRDFEVIGVLCYGEVMSPLKITASFLVMVGVIMLHIADGRIESGEDTQVSFLIGTPEKVADALELQPLKSV